MLQIFHRSSMVHHISSSSYFSLFWIIGLAILASIVGMALAIGNLLIAGSLVALIYAFILYSLFLARGSLNLRDSFFWMMFSMVFVTTSLHKFTGYSAYYVLEMSLIFAAPLLVQPLILLLNESKFFRQWFAAFAVFLLISLLSSAFGRSHAIAAAYQFMTNLKMIFILLLGFYISWSPRTNTIFWWLIRWLWLPMMLLVAWQWGHPSSYFSLMGHADPGTADPLHIFPSRALGPFQHPSYLALYTGIFTIFCVVNVVLGRGRRYAIFGLCYFLLLLASTERQETASAVIVSIAIFSLAQGKRFLIRSSIIGLIVALIIGSAGLSLIKDNLQREATDWGIVGHAKIQQPRQVLYLNAVEIADQYAPLGSGLGTFGSAGAVKYDMSLYIDRGFERYSWFGKENVLMDTYWTNFLAETGWGNTLLLMLLMILLVWFPAKHSMGSYPSEIQRLWFMAFGGMFFVFLLSLSSPSFQDPGLFLVPGIFIGVAYNRTSMWKKQKHQTTPIKNDYCYHPPIVTH